METAETWKSTIGSVIRFLLASLVGSLVTKGVVSAAQGEFIMMAAIGGAITVITLIWAHVKNRMTARLVQKALEAAPGTSLEAVKIRVAQDN